MGIRPEDREHLFDRFWRAEESWYQKGLGLGLSLAEKIVRLHQGKIQVYSQPGRGAVFEIMLPLNLSES